MNKVCTLIMLSFLLLLSACGNEAEKNKAESGTDKSNKEEQVTDSFPVETIEDIVEYYQRNGMTAEITTDKHAEIIGAKEGAGLKINGQTAEIYEFDPSSETFKTVKETNTLLDHHAVYNGNFVLMVYEDNENTEEILSIFQSFQPKK